MDYRLCGVKCLVASTYPSAIVVCRLAFVYAISIAANILRVTNAKYVKLLLAGIARLDGISLPLVVTLIRSGSLLLLLITHVLRV